VLGRQKDHVDFLKFILEILQLLPFNKEAVKEAGIGKSIKKLTKYTSKEHNVDALTAAAQTLMQLWMQLVKAQSNGKPSEVGESPAKYPAMVYALHAKLVQQRGVPGQHVAIDDVAHTDGETKVVNASNDGAESKSTRSFAAPLKRSSGPLEVSPPEYDTQSTNPAHASNVQSVAVGSAANSKQDGKRESRLRARPPSRKVIPLPRPLDKLMQDASSHPNSQNASGSHETFVYCSALNGVSSALTHVCMFGVSRERTSQRKTNAAPQTKS
jgi:hypothetical protein